MNPMGYINDNTSCLQCIQGIGIYSLLQSVGDNEVTSSVNHLFMLLHVYYCSYELLLNSYYRFQPSESQTKPHDPIYVDIGPSTTSQENTPRFLVPSCDDKVEYSEVEQTEKNTNSKPGMR